jgi:hypothetical protein
MNVNEDNMIIAFAVWEFRRFGIIIISKTPKLPAAKAKVEVIGWL